MYTYNFSTAFVHTSVWKRSTSSLKFHMLAKHTADAEMHGQLSNPSTSEVILENGLDSICPYFRLLQ